MVPTTLAYKLVRYSGLPFLLREVLFRRTTRIVMFHDPSAAAFDRALAYLTKRYTVITLDDLLSGRPLPPKALVITLDDGHAGNAALLPVIRKYKVRPTIFLCAGIIATQRSFWFLHKGLPRPVEELKELSNAERIEILRSIGYEPETEHDGVHALSRSDIEQMKTEVDLQSHGLFHPCLPKCTDADSQQEIAGSKHMLEEQFGLRITAFAFPNGDYSEREVSYVRQAGYSCALTVDYGFNRPNDDPFRLKRLSIDDEGNIDAVSAKASGAWTLLRVIAGKQRMNRMSASNNA